MGFFEFFKLYTVYRVFVYDRKHLYTKRARRGQLEGISEVRMARVLPASRVILTLVIEQ